MTTRQPPSKLTYGLVPGCEYVYIADLPAGCKGARYRFHRFILDVPVYQWKCLVEALTGPDAGLCFSCSPANFAIRYRPAGQEGTR